MTMRHPAFVLAMGRSGTMWLTQALRRTCKLDARHESIETCRGIETLSMGDVEVNSFLWECIPFMRQRWGEKLTLIHLVRDGRLVVRSMMARVRKDRTFEGCCREWEKRNRYLREHIPRPHLFRMEDITRNWAIYRELCMKLACRRPDYDRWVQMCKTSVNPTTDHLLVPYSKWPRGHKDLFWDICGDEMRRCGYIAKH